MIAAIPTGIVQAVAGATAVGLFMLLGKGADWLIKRRPERKEEKAAVKTEERADGAEERAEEQAGLARAKQLSDGWYQWGRMQEERAGQIAGERDAMERALTAKIEALGREIAEMRATLAAKDALISEQAQKISRLERRVGDLERHDRQSGQDIS